MVWVGRDLQRSPSSNPTAISRDTFCYTRLLNAPPILALNREEASTASLGNLF